MASYIEITFNSTPAIDSQLTIVDSLTGISMIEVFKNVRSGIGESRLGVDLDHNTFNYYQAFVSDYNNALLYNVTYDLITHKVTITAINPLSQFSEDSNTTAGAVTVNIVNDSVPTVFTIDSVVGGEKVGNACNEIEVTVTTNVNADNITSPVVTATPTNPYTFDASRSESPITITMDKDGTVDSAVYYAPQLLSVYFQIDVVNIVSGASVSVSRIGALSPSIPNILFTLEYSLDNVVWQGGSSWSGIEAGAKTLYIRDSVGCTLNIPFTVDAFESPNLLDFTERVEVSKANSLAFKLNQTIANCGIRRNNTNSLSYEENVGLNRRDFVQLYQQCDTIKTQIISNYETNQAVLVECDGTETPLVITQVTDNMNKKDVRDGKIYVLDTNEISVYFVAGNTYNPDTLVQEGSYNLGENIMDWLNVNDWINIQGQGWIKITRIIAPTNERPYYKVVLAGDNVDYGFSQDQAVQVTTIYNTVDYERHEFSIDMSALDGYYQVKISNTDSTFPALEWLSEWFWVKQEHKCKHHLIEYYNSENNEINYSTGISFRIRTPYVLNLKWKPNNEQDLYVTDTTTILLESRVREFYELNLRPMPTLLAQKVVLALSQDRLMIDGVTFLLEGEVSVVQFGVTNLYQIKATLIKSDYVFENVTGVSLAEITLTGGTPLNIDPNSEGLLYV